jgi:hypothetical protein
VELVLHGEYNGIESGRRTRDCLELRGVAVGVFEVINTSLSFRRRIAKPLRVLLAFNTEFCPQGGYPSSHHARHVANGRLEFVFHLSSHGRTSHIILS